MIFTMIEYTLLSVDLKELVHMDIILLIQLDYNAVHVPVTGIDSS